MTIRTKLLGMISVGVLALMNSGCTENLKPLLIDQAIGFLTAITGAATTSWINALFQQTTTT